MTFKETEYPGLIRSVLRIGGESVHAGRILKEAVEVDNQIPLYPGIVSMCMNALLEEVKIPDLKKGDTVVLKLSGGEEVLGKVDKTAKTGSITLKNASVLKKVKSFKFMPGKVRGLSRIKKDILQKTWPSLVFKSDKVIK